MNLHSPAKPKQAQAKNASTNQSAYRHFEIHSLAWFFENKQAVEQHPKTVQCFEIFYFVEGEGQLTVDFTSYSIQAKKAFCLYPGQVRQVNISRPSDGYYLSASADFVLLSKAGPEAIFTAQQLAGTSQPVAIEFNDERNDELIEVLFKLRKEFANYFLLRSEVLKSLFNLLSIYLARQLTPSFPNEPIRREQQLVRNFIALLKNNYVEKKAVADYASELFITPSYLNQVVKKVTGQPASYHIQQQIVLEAKRLARFTTQSMKEIAYQLGFDDIAHFSKFFKNNSGINFTKFKKELY